jgi:hypothetical protein
MLPTLGTWRGLLLVAFVLLVFAGMLLPNFLGPEVQRADPETVRTFAPLLILFFSLTSLLTSGAGKAIVFTMPEVEFLFPAPFTRRELLLYKLLGSVVGGAFTALFFSVVFLRFTTWWIAGFLGTWLALLLVQLVAMSVALVIQWIGERAYTRTRRLVVAALLVLLVAGALQAILATEDFNLLQLASSFRESVGGRIILAPFEVFGRAIAAEALMPDFVLWAGLAALINAALAAVVLFLDANYLEAATVASQKRYELLVRAQRGRMTAVGGSHTVRWRLPELPWLGGAGPIAWRQAIQLARSSPRTLLVLLFVAIGAGPGVFAMRSESTDATNWVIGAIVWATFLVTSILPTGFRGDLDYMDFLKGVPLSPLAVVVGELLPPVLFVTLLQIAILAGFAATGIAAQTSLVVAAACFALPANLLFLITENLLFLRYPTRIAPSSPGDLQFMGRQMLMMFARVLILLAASGLAVGAAGLAYLAGVQSLPILAGIAWCVLMAEAVLLIFAVVRAFRSFDPSVDMPA